MDKQTLNELLDKYTNGLASAAEKQALLDWYRNEAYQEALFPDAEDITGQRMLQRLNREINPISKRKSAYVWWSAAASVLMVFGIGVYYFTKHRPAATPQATMVKLAAKPVLPGSNQAMLTLANGKQIPLGYAHNGQLAVQGNTIITKAADGQIVYNNTGNRLTASIAYNTISTPNGGQFKVTLPDGSCVWLNAASSLSYPTAFTGAERLVKLTGEGYYEVTKNAAQPFKVDVNGQQQIEVLGTHFDIEAYADDHNIKTTLLEGSVKLSYQNNRLILKPGQMAVNDMAGQLQVKSADIDEVMAWKNGLFTFNDENIKDAMRKVARWYDIDVTYQGNVLKKRIGGTVSRYKNITDLLDNITKTGAVHYKIEGRRVTLMN